MDIYRYIEISVYIHDIQMLELPDGSYTICNESVVLHASPGDPERLDTVSVLEAMCSKILESKVHTEHSVRVGVCNILLQRVQSIVPISRGAQQRLNGVLFGERI